MAKSPKPPVLAAYDPDDRAGRLRDVGGSTSDKWNNIVANQVINSLWTKYSDPTTRETQFTAALAALTGIAPRDELEGMVAAQLIAAHSAAMECYRRAMLHEQTFEGRRESLAQANKLSRSFTTLLEALNRHRGKGQQKVTVEHVHIHSGGQAIVGSVGSPGGGQPRKIEDQPHAKQLSDARLPEVPGEDAKEDPLPVSSHVERPLPNARGLVSGGAKG